MSDRAKSRFVTVSVVLAAGLFAMGFWLLGENAARGGGERGAGRGGPPEGSTAFVPPPESGPEQWNMPGLWQRGPPFPYLLGEDREKSRSIGGVVHGYLVNSVRIPQPHPALAFLDVQHERKLYYTTDRMRELVEAAARHVRDHHPEAIVRLGNFGNPGGGDIPYSFSHNSGRDADLGFFLRGSDGDPAVPPDLVSLDDSGSYDGEHGTFDFDVERNWRLVEGLIEAGGDQLQYIFISNALGEMLLDHAREIGAEWKVRSRARQMLHQPSGSLPHDDHFHLRIYCSKVDVESGCWDRGVKHPWYDDYSKARATKVEEALEQLQMEEAETRTRATRRLALLEAQGARDELIDLLSDGEPVVRAAAARALSRLETGSGAIGDRLDHEDDPQTYVEMIDALGRLGTDLATRRLVAALDSVRTLELTEQFSTDARTFVAEALIRTERTDGVEKLVGLLEADAPRVRLAAAQALRYLTNHRFGSNWLAESERLRKDDLEAWEKWFATHGDESRETWLKEGFREAGYEVGPLGPRDAWKLCRAVTDADHLSYNAQRRLMKIADRYPESLSWPKEDANVFWRRWFEKRRARYGVPPAPDEEEPERGEAEEH